MSNDIGFFHFVGTRAVASGEVWGPLPATKAPHQFSMLVDLDHQGSQVPANLQDYLLSKIEEAQPAAIASEALEYEDYRTRLLESARFARTMRFPRSKLDVREFNHAGVEAHIGRLQDQGLEFVTLSEVIKRDPGWQRHVWQMFTHIEADVPDAESVLTTPFEEYAAYYDGNYFCPESWQIALDTILELAASYVGMCAVNIMPNRPDTLFGGITGVLRSHRRRKIATVLKVYSADYARRSGYRYIYTDNEEHNPMYTLNLQLGYKPLPAGVYYRRG